MINLILLASLFHFVNAPFVTMRESPVEKSEVVSQAYFSEEVRILEERADYIKIETAVDSYPRWIKTDQLCQREALLSYPAKVSRCMAHLYITTDTIYGPILTLPIDSTLEVLEQIAPRWHVYWK